MSIEDKVDSEIEADKRDNAGAIFMRVATIIAGRGERMEPGDEQFYEVATALGNDAEARVYEWHWRAGAYVLSLSPEERHKLELTYTKTNWAGSDEVTDLSEYRQSHQD